MSILKTYSIQCDGYFNRGHCPQWTGESMNLMDARKWAKDQGWRVSAPGGRDFCPECVQRDLSNLTGKKGGEHDQP